MPKEKQNLSQQDLLQEIYNTTKKTHKYIVWLQVLSIIRTILIIIPIVLAIIYLPPFFKKVTEPYRQLINSAAKNQNFLEDINLNEWLEMYK